MKQHPSLFPACVIFLVLSHLAPVSSLRSEELTVEQLKNTQYYIPGWEEDAPGEWVMLQDGKYIRDTPEDPLRVEVVAAAVGYLSNEKNKDGAVIYGFNSGGTGFFLNLCAVKNVGRKLIPSTPISLEDRAKINSLAIVSGQVVLDWTGHQGNDPAPLPTLRKTTRYGLVGNMLMEAGDNAE